jgi:hypothetical protein
MTSKKTTVVSSTVRPACKFPGCDQPAAPADNPGRPPEYCAGRGHPRVGVEGAEAGERGEERRHGQRGG